MVGLGARVGIPLATGYVLYRGAKSGNAYLGRSKPGRTVRWLGAGVIAWGAGTYMFTGTPGSVTPPELLVRREQSDTLNAHAIFVDRSGYAVFGDPFKERPLDQATYAKYVDVLMDSVRKSTRHTLLIRIHGGLNELDEAPTRDMEFIRAIRGDTLSADSSARDYYPLLINWQSSLRSTYRAHLLGTFPSAPMNDVRNIATAPYQFLSDLVEGVVRSPFALYSAISSARKYRTMLASTVHTESSVDSVNDMIDTNAVMNVDGGFTHHAIGRYFQTRENVSRRVRIAHRLGTALDYPLSFVQPVFAPVIATFAVPAWIQMHKRARTLFRDATDVDNDSLRQSGAYRSPRGAVGVLLESLSKCFAEHAGRCRGEDSTLGVDSVVLMGHSMGAIIATGILQRYDLPYSDVVFMAAASTITDFDRTVIPFLQEHKTARFYNLTLHPACEYREHIGWISPYGSLLTWLDGFLATPETSFDQTFGRWNSVVRAAHLVPDSIADRVYLKAFGHYDPNPAFGTYKGSEPTYGTFRPCKHGDFNDADLHAWRRSVWMTPADTGRHTMPR